MHLGKSTSISSMCWRLLPVLFNAALIAGTGPIPMIDGSTPATEYETILASGVKLCSLRAFSLTTISAAAPSHIPYKKKCTPNFGICDVITPLIVELSLMLEIVFKVKDCECAKKLDRTSGPISSTEATCLLVSTKSGDFGWLFSVSMHRVLICNNVSISDLSRSPFMMAN